MTAQPQTTTFHSQQPMKPHWAELLEVENEAPGVYTFWIRFKDQALQDNYFFEPGQFNMLSDQAARMAAGAAITRCDICGRASEHIEMTCQPEHVNTVYF